MPGTDKNSGPSVPGILLRREAGLSLSEQIREGITQAIDEGRLKPGSRVPSCRDLAAQLGVARGTVRAAYDMLVDSQRLVAKGAAGTWVTDIQRPPGESRQQDRVIAPLAAIIHAFDSPPLTFQMGVPANDAFPAKVWSRILTRHAREMVSKPTGYSDPRGSLALRQQLVSYLSMARGIRCQASQVMITNGYAGALGLICLALGLRGKAIWTEDPGYLLARKALTLAGVETIPVAVDEQGLCVEEGIRQAPDAAAVLVTPGQQAPLGMTLSLERRAALLAWARRHGSWIIEDDYLGELQLEGRAAPALAALDDGCVLHIGTFSKTLSPSLRLGYLVVPAHQAAHFGEAAALLAPASSFVLHNAVAEFLLEGHFMRHLRRMKRLYNERLIALLAALQPLFPQASRAALAVIIALPEGCQDTRIAHEALAYGMAPTPLSVWYQDQGRRGLVLSVTTLPKEGFTGSALRLKALIEQFG
ncbi:MocR-like pyridoxine biosynthesis transcription factor PdxR [Erwinia sorbitola]|uniref:Aminotransferase class I/II-fold pyridoxal phosphate-dependent enzyme n=1 Tax=Erwinia sorbitola TaxID=2681984 RepID=A0A6I6EMN3_9GAMM|nr:PLP-dependent aminotransferase family protein [Erwinia sorbitola]MTD28914.1 aminotransferase class I/II-fold pyridoxal phosphate-dependent enzyme [Erwinia sorbitola]QGU89435.1 aminotransferase class I/II-fold pyridoxal phosphate-dependent enzyme [Erwinia sorbitola]